MTIREGKMFSGNSNRAGLANRYFFRLYVKSYSTNQVLRHHSNLAELPDLSRPSLMNCRCRFNSSRPVAEFHRSIIIAPSFNPP